MPGFLIFTHLSYMVYIILNSNHLRFKAHVKKTFDDVGRHWGASRERKEKMRPLELIYGELPAKLITFSAVCVVRLQA